MRPILFCSWDLSEHKKWMPPSPNWDGLPVGRHFQNGRHQNLWNYIFANNSVSIIDRDNILMSKPMFMLMRNPMITLTNLYDAWLTRTSKPAEITLISQWAQYWQVAIYQEKSMPPPLNLDGLPI